MNDTNDAVHHPSADVPYSNAKSLAVTAEVTAAAPNSLGITHITGCILARNEETRIEAALQSLASWCDQIIVLDNESTDQTAAIAARYNALVIPVLSPPDGANFDALRNKAIPHATGEWIFYLDADERVPPRLGPLLQKLVRERGDQFEALLLPFKHFFCGQWMQHCNWWPGYTRPQLLKKGTFTYNERLHTGVHVEGRTLRFPADDPDLALVHYSYDDLTHYLTKFNSYTTGEAHTLRYDGQSHTWQAQLAAFVHDWRVYYEQGRGDLDGMHGFILSFLSAAYRLVSRAKLWDERRAKGELTGAEPVPASVREMLEFMASVAQNGAEPHLIQTHPAIRPGDAPQVVPPDWFGSTFIDGVDPSTYYQQPQAISAREKKSTVTAWVLARNEETRIQSALQSLRGWVDQIIVIDNESTDRTRTVAEPYADLILSAAKAEFENNFNAARNLAEPHTTGNWVFILDADERVPGPLAEAIVRLLTKRGDQFDALALPSRNIVCGKWLSSPVWWPGYKNPYLLRRGTFTYNTRLHGGISYSGRLLRFPAQGPSLAIVHESVADIAAYIDKLNRYTDVEARNMAGETPNAEELIPSHSWQAQLAHFTSDWVIHYDKLRAHEDGMHGFVFAFLCSFYRFVSRAKLWDVRRKDGLLPVAPEPVPATLREMLEFMARVTIGGAEPWLQVPALSSVPDRLPLLWAAPIYDPSGYADEARNFVLSLVEAGEPVAVAPTTWSKDDARLPDEVRAILDKHTLPIHSPTQVFVSQTTPPLHQVSPHALVNVARTMFETDRLQPGWETVLNRMDRVWVPSAFNRDTFIKSGVAEDKIAVIPGCMDATLFADPIIEPYPLPGEANAFRFLAVFDWSLHKGWDVLLEAFAREFGDPKIGNTDETHLPVSLIIKTWSSLNYSLDDIKAQADSHLLATVGKPLSAFPNIHLWQENVPQAQMPRLYKAASAYVAPTRGEGWCRPLMEAMAAGLPTIATGWSGLTEFHNAKVGYPLKYKVVPVSEAGAMEIPIYRGHEWAEPDVADLRRLLRHVARTQPEAAKRKGKLAQKHIAASYSRAAVAKILQDELSYCRSLAQEKAARTPMVIARPAPVAPAAPLGSPDNRLLPLRPAAHLLPLDPVAPVDFTEALSRPMTLHWVGDVASLTSLAHVNRQMVLALMEPTGKEQAKDDITLSITSAGEPGPYVSQEKGGILDRLREKVVPLSAQSVVGVTVRHHWPPNWQRPANGKLVVMQPWELSHLPDRDWVKGATEADAVWAYSRFVRDAYVRSGVPAEKVRIVPLGVDNEAFTPEGNVLQLPTNKTIRFLFVGGTVDRKGADLLLAAYLKAFTLRDDVCLVVKDMGTRTFYRGATTGDAFRRAQTDPNAPEIIYLDNDLSEAELAALYRACTSIVLPYRGEGFGLSPLEGMACGLVPIVTAGGPTDDYMDDTMALRVPYRRRVLNDLYKNDPNRVVDSPWDIEPDSDALVAALRWVAEHPEEAKERGKRAHAHVLRGWDWKRAAAVARKELFDLVSGDTKSEGAPPTATLWAEPAPTESKSEEAVKASTAPASGKRKTKSASTKRAKTVESAAELVVELSLCLIARDEEARIGACLTSIRPFVDEMIVVDTGSTDKTREIALACGARVYDFPWTNSFAEARNQSLNLARGQWIFWMDADDVISADCGAKLRELIAHHPNRDAAYQVSVHIPPGENEYSASVVDHVKLFPNRPDLRFEHRIHEQILPSLRKANIPILPSDVFVTHEHYDRSPEGQTKKRQRDFTLLSLDLQDYPEHPFVLFNLGMTHLYATHEYEVAAHYLERSLRGSHWKDSIVRKTFALLTTARTAQQEWELALKANEVGRKHYPDDAELLFQAGQIYQQVGQFGDARAALETLVAPQTEDAGGHYRSVDVGLRTYRGQQELALLFARMGDKGQAVQILERVAQEHPHYRPARADLDALIGKERTG